MLGHQFYFVAAARILGSEGPLPVHQEMRSQQGWFRMQTIGVYECMNFVKRECVAVSYVWATPYHPDPKGEMADALRVWLRKNPQIHFVWLDWCSLPQKVPDRTPDEAEEFRHGLEVMSMIYLSCNVLKVANSQYCSRFWPQFECWLSFHQLQEKGEMQPDKRRTHLAFTGRAAVEPKEAQRTEESLDDRWSSKSMSRAISELSHSDFQVTNARDKEVQFAKMAQFMDLVGKM